MRDRTADVVIVGGGVIGCLTAYYLSRAGQKVTVVEADGVASGASGTSGGWLTPYSHANDPAMLALSPKSLALHRDLAAVLMEETGVDHGFEETPYLRCALTEDGVVELRAWQADRAAEGTRMEWITQDDARQINPWLTAEIVGALVSNDEPTLDSYRLTLSALQAAEKHGANIVSGRVIDLPVGERDGRVTGVKLEDGTRISGGAVLLAMGPWTATGAVWIKSPLPVSPQRGQMVYLAPPAKDEGPDLKSGLTAVEISCSMIKKSLTDTTIGSTREDVGFDRSTTVEARDLLLSQAARLCERVFAAPISGQTACLRPITPDGRPYVGRAPKWDNVFVAAGHASEGIHYAPVTALAMSGLITEGKAAVDISALDPARVDRS
ncbi:MAG: FAD-binding oxidoreductase [Dehalococcoidia bacterium]|jgi:glycine oxidase|nr:FAD-binding oxidoreductase [Dehalococcoidia bacterium]